VNDEVGKTEKGLASASRRGWTSWLFECADLKFGIWSTWILLAITVLIAFCPIEFSDGQRAAKAATIFAWIPESVLRDGTFFVAVRVCLLGSVALWAMRIWTPVSCWLTVIFGVLHWSLRMENLTNGAHIFTVTNMLLVVHAMWFQFYNAEIKAGLAGGDRSLRQCYPRWVFWLCVFYLGWFHSLAGFTKIATTGFGWGNGLSLQLWTNLFGWEPSPFGQLLMYDTRLTAWMQSGALAIECASILMIFHRWIRYAIGFGLFGFYLGVLTTFVTFGFHFNAILVAWFLLPVDWWMGLKFLPAVGKAA
jgi:hypothetical protein